MPAIVGSEVRTGVVVHGGSAALAAEPTAPAFAAKVFRHPDYTTPHRVLTGLSDFGWQDRVGETGTATITIPNEHPDQLEVAVDDLVRFELHGSAAFMAALGNRENHQHPGGTNSPETVLTGTGHIGLLSEMVVLPARGPGVKPVEVDRLFSWPAPEFDDTSWPAAIEIQAQETPSEDWGGLDVDHPLLPVGWPEGSGAKWIFDATGSPSWAPAGTRYARRTFTIPGGTTRVMVYFGTDWRGELYFDGQLILTQDVDAGSWVGTTSTQVVDVTPGPHTLAVWCENDVDPEGDMTHNPGGFVVALYAMNPVGTLDAYPLLVSDANWRLIFPPSPPGMTPGEVIIIILEEAQALGYLTGWEVTFTKHVDSNGVPWPVVGDISTKVGTDYATFVLDELAQTYCDVRAQPGGLVLDAYVPGGLGGASTVDFTVAADENDPTSGNLTELTFARQATTATSFLVRWQGGWRLVDSSPDGRKKMASLGLGALPSEPEVDRVAGAELARKAHPRDAITTGFYSTVEADTPYVGFRPGDTVTVPGEDGTPTRERVMGITVSADSTSKESVFALELIDVLHQQWERDSTALKKLSDGTLRGDARPAQPTSSVGPAGPGPNCCPPQPPPGFIG